MQQGSEWSVIGRLLRLMRAVGMNPMKLILPMFCSLIAGAFEGISMGLLIPLLQGFLSRDFSFIQNIPVLSDAVEILRNYVAITDRSLFIFIVVLFFVAVLLKGILRYASVMGMIYIGSWTLDRLRKEIFKRYLRFGKLYFDRTSVGYHTTMIAQYTSNVVRPLFTTDKYISAVFSIAAYLVTMLLISWKLTLIALPAFLIVHLLMTFVIRRIAQTSREITIQNAALSRKSVDIFSSIPLVQSFNSQDAEQRAFSKISDHKAQLDVRDNALQQLVFPFQETITLIAAIGLFMGMLYLLVLEGEATPSAFIVYFYLVINAGTKLGMVTGLRSNLASSLGALEEVEKIFDDGDKETVPDGTRSFTGLQKGIDFRSARFTYTDREVLKGVTFSIPRGGMTAIVGPTGAGKSTITHLLLRFYDAPPGAIFVDDVDIRDYKIDKLRDHMALVSQETFLLHDTMRANIAYGMEDASEGEIADAVRRARLDELIQRLPEGLETVIGDRGVRLSGGEKQRVSIARALLRGADILILDEATSALDSHTESLIQEAIEDARAGKTAIVIAHRLSTIKHADNIVVLENGRVVEEGTLDALLKKDAKFASYWREQKF